MSRILLIDDDEHVNLVIRTALEMVGHDVVTCDGSDDAAIFSATPPDILLVDLMLPGRSGIDLLKELSVAFPSTIRILATGMADFDLLGAALEAGATTMLCKPYRISDLTELIGIANELSIALKCGDESAMSDGASFSITRSGDEPILPEDMTRLAAFARRCGADDDVACRRLPIVANELLKNARHHGAAKTPNGIYRIDLYDVGDHLELMVNDTGPGFDWWKVISRARCGMDKSRASGLQLVCALAHQLRFENGGRLVRLQLPKHVGASPRAVE